MNIWRIIANKLNANTGGMNYALLRISVADRSITGYAVRLDGSRKEQRPIPTNRALVQILADQVKNHLSTVTDYTLEFKHTDHTLTLTAYGIDREGNKAQRSETLTY